MHSGLHPTSRHSWYTFHPERITRENGPSPLLPTPCLFKHCSGQSQSAPVTLPLCYSLCVSTLLFINYVLYIHYVFPLCYSLYVSTLLFINYMLCIHFVFPLCYSLCAVHYPLLYSHSLSQHEWMRAPIHSCCDTSIPPLGGIEVQVGIALGSILDNKHSTFPQLFVQVSQ